jgi:hypothetical protein
MSYLQDLIIRHGASNVFFYGPASPLNDAGFMRYVSSSDETTNMLFAINEDQDKVSDNYKISLVPLIPAFARERFYISDLDTMVNEDRFMCLVKSTGPVSREFLIEQGLDKVHLLTDAHRVRKIIGMPIGADLRNPVTGVLLSIKKIDDTVAVFDSDDSEIWAPVYSFDAINALIEQSSSHVLLIEQKSANEHYAAP